ncbi:MAG: DHH family phosphoesterase [Patescibacteria group bacterium]
MNQDTSQDSLLTGVTMDKDIEKIKDIVEGSNKILIVSHTRPTYDSIASVLLVWHFLSINFKKKIDIYIPKFPERLELLLNYSMLLQDDIQDEYPKLEYTISIKKDDVKIDSVRYEYDKSNFKFHVKLHNGELDTSNVNIQRGEFSYDTIFTVDTPDLNYLGELYKVYKKDLDNKDKIKIVNIDSHIDNKQYGMFNLTDNNVNSTAQIIYHMLIAIDSIVSKKDYQLVLMGILSNTDFLHGKSITEKTFMDVSNIINKGGDLNLATIDLSAPRSISDLKEKFEILKNAKEVEFKKSTFVISNIKQGELTSTSLLNDIYIKGALFTCIFVGEGIRPQDNYKIYLKDFGDVIKVNNIKKLYSDYKLEAGVYVFRDTGSIDDIVKKIIGII